MRKIIWTVAGVFITAGAIAAVSTVTVPYSFTANTRAESAKVNSNFSAIATGINNAIGAINTAAGTKTSLNSRLSVSLNADGTFKNVSGVMASNQWTNPGLVQAYEAVNKFSAGTADHTDIYAANRRIKAVLSASTVYSEVVSSVFSGGVTIVTIADSVLDNTLDYVEHSTFSPVGATDSAMSSKSTTGYNSDTANTASTLVRRNAFGNFSSGQITGTSFKGPLTGAVTGNVTGTASAATTATNASGTGTAVYAATTATKMHFGWLKSDGSSETWDGGTATRTGLGAYIFNHAAATTKAVYVTPTETGGGIAIGFCSAFGIDADHFHVYCYNAAGTATDFSIYVLQLY